MVRPLILSIRNAAATDFGGAEKVPVLIAREINQSEKASVLILSASHKLLQFAKDQAVPHKKTWWWKRQNWSGPNVLLTPVYFLWQVLLYFYYLILFLRHKPSLVHIQSKDDFIAATLAAATLNTPVFWSDYADLKHIWLNHRIWYKNPVGKFIYWCARFANEIIVVSKEDMKLITKNIPKGIVSKKLRVIYYGAFDTRLPKGKSDQFTYVSTARLVRDKGIKELILAFQKLHSEYPETRLELVGDGPEKDIFKRLAKNDPSIHFLGHQPNPISHLATSDVFVLPTYHEGFSIALVEACMQGLAIIATDVGGNPEIINNGKNGLIVEAKDVDSLYNAMKQLYLSEPLRTRLARSARLTYETSFDFAEIIKKEFIPIYTESR